METQQTTKELQTYRVLILCAIVILLEGFDIQAAGVSAPKISSAFNLMPLGKGIFLGAGPTFAQATGAGRCLVPGFRSS